MAYRVQALLFLVMALLSVVWCDNVRKIVPSIRHMLVEEESYESYRDLEDHFQAYPSYFNILEDGKFRGFIEQTTDISTREKLSTSQKPSVKKVSVAKYGAKGDGDHDDTEAFEKAWSVACSSKTEAILSIPEGYDYLVKPITFKGPCKSSVSFVISGTILASDDRNDYRKDKDHWIQFEDVENLLVGGDGTINGNGEIWWKNSCKVNKDLPCKNAPTALTFYNCKNLKVKDFKIQDAQQMHIRIQKCTDVDVSNLVVTAPEKSPNTDGIHVTETQNIHISNCVIGTGDDCISIVSGSENVLATDITCGPGHGISIGSLGKKNSEEYVSNILVNGAKITGTMNGVRIKTWQGGSGSATNITFENIEMENVSNPIIIDQNYCIQDGPCKAQKKAVKVKSVLYKNIKGTSASDVAIKFDCSKSIPCEQVVLQNVDLKLQVKEDEEPKAICSSIQLLDIGSVSPKCY